LWQRQTILYKTQTKFWCEHDIFIPPKLGKGQTAWRKLLTSSRCVRLESVSLGKNVILLWDFVS
jgi:hypothetical protein